MSTQSPVTPTMIAAMADGNGGRKNGAKPNPGTNQFPDDHRAKPSGAEPKPKHTTGISTVPQLAFWVQKTYKNEGLFPRCTGTWRPCLVKDKVKVIADHRTVYYTTRTFMRD